MLFRQWASGRSRPTRTLHDYVGLVFVDADAASGTTLTLADLSIHTTVEKDHGRIERRWRQVIGDPEYHAYIDPKHAWPNL